MAVTYDNGYTYDTSALNYDGTLLLADGHGRPTIGVFASAPTATTPVSATQVGGQTSRPELT